MWIGLKWAIAVALCTLGLCPLRAQESTPLDGANSRLQNVSSDDERASGRALTADDRQSLIAAALDRTSHLRFKRDCSHLVHAIYERAGFPYGYAPSSEIYAGIEEFEPVKRPQAGDLVVWRGHVGIVIKPSQHVFFSYLRSGPGIDDYQAEYWKSRGRPRFYRYIKGLCEGCDSRVNSSRQLLKIKK
jgi:cell wall-associated NlpC family hydrolase